jgi:hypothetical protein
MPARHLDTLGPQPKPHVELNVTAPSAVAEILAVSASGGAGGEPTSFVINQIS